MRADLEGLEETIGFRFENREILVRALTHSSHVHENTPAAVAGGDNEQLEFLGDSVLGFLISEALIRRLPGESEGRLSKIKAHLVSAAHLHEVAREIGLGQYLQLGRGEEMNGGRSKKTLLVDALEALIAAMYLDGGLERTREFVTHFVLGPAGDDHAMLQEPLPQSVMDFKSALQELAQARKLPQPRYSIVRERGPEHSKTFTIEVRVGREWVGQADGFTKKSAAQKAAREVYQRLVAGAQTGDEARA
ncbi:MAG TPA: ribonuclease III [Bryobacteraceae bacterium]|nr:ribonuclease III [Bryobacteraceae bacterium]